MKAVAVVAEILMREGVEFLIGYPVNAVIEAVAEAVIRTIIVLREQVILPEAVPDAMRRAFTQVKNGRPRPVLVELPVDVMREDVPDGWTYTPAPRLRTAPDPRDAARVADALVGAERPVIYAGQGV